jgi:hypothetical protein
MVQPVNGYPKEKMPQVKKIQSTLELASDALTRAQAAWSTTQAWWALKELHGHVREALQALTYEEPNDES